MIEVKVPKDILKYKTRLVGPFTSRQILCLGIALAFDVLFYKLAYQPLGMPVEFLFSWTSPSWPSATARRWTCRWKSI